MSRETSQTRDNKQILSSINYSHAFIFGIVFMSVFKKCFLLGTQRTPFSEKLSYIGQRFLLTEVIESDDTAIFCHSLRNNRPTENVYINNFYYISINELTYKKSCRFSLYKTLTLLHPAYAGVLTRILIIMIHNDIF